MKISLLKKSLYWVAMALIALPFVSACGPGDQLQDQSTNETDLAQTSDSLSVSGRTYLLPTRGGSRGGFRALRCPQGYVAVGIFGRSGGYIDQLGLECAYLNPNGSLGSHYSTGTAGGYGGVYFSISCPARQAIVGVRGRSGGYVDRLGIYCAGAFHWRVYGTVQYTSYETGGYGGASFSDTCPGAYMLTGLNLWAGQYVDREQGICSYINP